MKTPYPTLQHTTTYKIRHWPLRTTTTYNSAAWSASLGVRLLLAGLWLHEPPVSDQAAPDGPCASAVTTTHNIQQHTQHKVLLGRPALRFDSSWLACGCLSHRSQTRQHQMAHVHLRYNDIHNIHSTSAVWSTYNGLLAQTTTLHTKARSPGPGFGHALLRGPLFRDWPLLSQEQRN